MGSASEPESLAEFSHQAAIRDAQNEARRSAPVQIRMVRVQGLNPKSCRENTGNVRCQPDSNDYSLVSQQWLPDNDPVRTLHRVLSCRDFWGLGFRMKVSIWGCNPNSNVLCFRRAWTALSVEQASRELKQGLELSKKLQQGVLKYVNSNVSTVSAL